MNIFKLSGLILVASAVLVGCGTQNGTKNEEKTKNETKQTSKATALKVGEYAPDLKLQNLKGETVSLSSLVGKKVYLKFWASWCGPCKESIPELLKLMDNKDRNFEVLTVVAPSLNGEKSREDFKKWYVEQGYENLPVFFDETGDIFKAYQVRSVPTVVIIDSLGKVAKIKLGTLNNSDTLAFMKDVN